MVPTIADSKMSVEITTEASYQGQGTCGCWCKADFKAVMRRCSQYLEMLCSVWGWRTEMFDWQWLGEALGNLTGWGEPRAGMQEMDVDSKSGECRSLNGCKKLWIKVDSLAPRITAGHLSPGSRDLMACPGTTCLHIVMATLPAPFQLPLWCCCWQSVLGGIRLAQSWIMLMHAVSLLAAPPLNW